MAADSRWSLSLPTAESTLGFGRDVLAPLLQPGDLVIASGPLGVGKTALIQGIGAGLRVRGPVLSPTFVIARVHRGGRIPLVHVDAYRLHSITEMDDLDLDAELADSVTVVEWGEGLVEHLSDEHLLIELTWAAESAGSPPHRHCEVVEGPEAPGAEARSALLTAYGPRWQARLLALTAP